MKYINGRPYDFSNSKPLHFFINEKLGSNMSVFKDHNGYSILQKNNNGYQTRIKLDEVSFNNFINKLDSHGWTEMQV